MNDFQIGQRVVFTHPLVRQSTWDKDSRRSGRTWQPHPYTPLAEQEQEGIIIGKRTLANGDCDPWEEEVGVIFHPKEHFPAYLIATDLHRNPSTVRVENVKLAPLKSVDTLPEAVFYTPEQVRQLAAKAWLEGAAAGASVDMGFLPSDALERDLPDRLAGQFYALNPYTQREA